MVLLTSIIIFIFQFFLTRKKVVLALASLSAILPFYVLRFNILGIPSTALEMAILGTVLGYLFAKKDLKLLWQRLRILKYPLALFFTASLIGIFISPDKFSALGIWRAYFLESALIFVMLLAEIKNWRDFSAIIFGLSISSIYLSIIAIAQRFFALPIPEPWQNELRVTSIFPYPNALGLYLSPILILFLGEIITNFKNKTLIFFYYSTCVLLSMIAIILAKSDGAIFAFLGGLIIFYSLSALGAKKIKGSVFIIFILIIAAASILFFNISSIKEKIFLEDWSGFVRYTVWGETINMLRDNWFFGAGISGYQMAILPYHESREWMEVFIYPHNIILNFWSEIGLIGLVGFLWLLEKFGRLCYTLWKKEKAVAITAISAMVALLIHGLVDVSFFKNDLSVLFWIIYASAFVSKK